MTQKTNWFDNDGLPIHRLSMTTDLISYRWNQIGIWLANWDTVRRDPQLKAGEEEGHDGWTVRAFTSFDLRLVVVKRSSAQHQKPVVTDVVIVN